MSPLTTPRAPRPTSPPRLGIFVDCRHFKAKIRPSVPPQSPRPPAPRGGSRWPLVLLLGFTALFGVSIAAGTVHAFLGPRPAPVTVAPVAQVVQAKQPVSADSAAKRNMEPAKDAKSDSTPPPQSAPAVNHTAKESPVPEPVEYLTEGPPAKDPVQSLLRQVTATKEGSVCGTQACKGSGDLCGTAVAFRPSPKLAEEEAVKQHKLVFVLHVSGNFEDPGFT